MQSQVPSPSFFGRLKLALRVLSDVKLAQAVLAGPTLPPGPSPTPVAPTLPPKAPTPSPQPAPDHTSGLALLGMLQREGRLIDFLQEDITSFPDADIGAAARVVHAGAKKILAQYFTFEPVLPNVEGETVTVKAGFDAQRIRLSGNVAGQPPFKGSLRHHGWYASDVRLPSLSAAMDPKVISPAEVEL